MKMLHKPHYPVAMQMMKKFVSKEDIRPVLKMVYHKDDGSIVATDSHHLLLVKDVHGFRAGGGATNIVCEGGLLVDPKTFEMAENETLQTDEHWKGKTAYPNTDTIIPPRKEDTIRLTLDQVKVWHQAHKSMKQMSDALKHDNYHVNLIINQHSDGKTGLTNEITLSFKAGDTILKMNLPFEKVNYIGSELVGPDLLTTIRYKAQCMADALETMVKLKVNEVGIQFGENNHHPFSLWSEDEKVVAMVMPVRIV